MAKERLIPKQTLAVVGVASLIALSVLYEARKGHEPLKTHYDTADALILDWVEGGFILSDKHNSYEFVGKYEGANRRNDWMAIGFKTNDECGVAIVRDGKDIITVYDPGINPYRVYDVTESTVSFYSEHPSGITDKTYFYNQDIMTVGQSYEFAWIAMEGGWKPC